MILDADLKALFADNLQRFNAERCSHDQWLQQVAMSADGTRERYRQMCELGWLDLLRHQSPSGRPAVADLLPLAIAAGQGLWREPILGTLAAAGAILQCSENTEERDRVLDAWTTGAELPAFAHREPGNGWRDPLPQTLASKTPLGYAIDGNKTLVMAASICDTFLVSARLQGDTDASVFAVAADQPSVTIHSYPTIDNRSAGKVIFRQATARRLCRGHQVVRLARSRGQLLAAAEAIGTMQGAIELTTTHLTQRRQFGRALAAFQALQHRFVDMVMLQRESQALLEATADVFDRASTGTAESLLMLQAQTFRAATKIAQEAIQMHGGMGITHELRIGHYYKRMLMLESLHGTADHALDGLTGIDSD